MCDTEKLTNETSYQLSSIRELTELTMLTMLTAQQQQQQRVKDPPQLLFPASTSIDTYFKLEATISPKYYLF